MWGEGKGRDRARQGEDADSSNTPGHRRRVSGRTALEHQVIGIARYARTHGIGRVALATLTGQNVNAGSAGMGERAGRMRPTRVGQSDRRTAAGWKGDRLHTDAIGCLVCV